MSAIETKMKILLGLRGFSIVKVSDTTALWKINSVDSLNIDVSKKPEEWEAKHKGKPVDWNSGIGIPANIKGMIETLVDDYNAALETALDDIGEYTESVDPLDNLKAGGFEIEGEAQEAKENDCPIESPRAEEIGAQNGLDEAEIKAREEREDNLRKLAELERLEQQMSEAEERKIQEMAKREAVKEAVHPPVRNSTPENKQSKTPLLDLIYDYVGNDVLEVFGDTGSGKTAFVKKVAYEAAAAGKKVFYLDTERNLTKNDIDLLKKCKYQYTPVIEEIDRVIQTLPAGDVVILDSVGFPVLTTFARMNMKQKGDALLKMIAIFGSLKEWAYKNNGIVLVTNQPESEFNKAPNHVLRPFGDKSQFAAKEIWETIKISSTAELTQSNIKAFRSRSVGHGKQLAKMSITVSGVEVVSNA